MSLKKLFKIHTDVSNTRFWLRQFVLITTELSLWIGYPCLLYPNNKTPNIKRILITLQNQACSTSVPELRLSVCFLITPFLFMPYGTGCNYMITYCFFPKHLQIVGIHLMSRCLIFWALVVPFSGWPPVILLKLHFKGGIINFLMTSITPILMVHKQFTYFHSSSLKCDGDLRKQGKKYLLNFDAQCETQTCQIFWGENI